MSRGLFGFPPSLLRVRYGNPADVANGRRNGQSFFFRRKPTSARSEHAARAKAMQRAIEGDCQPVFWQGIVVGHIRRKFDSRLQIL